MCMGTLCVLLSDCACTGPSRAEDFASVVAALVQYLHVSFGYHIFMIFIVNLVSTTLFFYFDVSTLTPFEEGFA